MEVFLEALFIVSNIAAIVLKPVVHLTTGFWRFLNPDLPDVMEFEEDGKNPYRSSLLATEPEPVEEPETETIEFEPIHGILLGVIVIQLVFYLYIFSQ